MAYKLYKKNKLVFGVGINDADHPVSENGVYTKSYRAWTNMLNRAYGGKYQENKPTYIGVSVCPEWLYFSNFEKWYDENYIEGWHLDKDLLDKDNREYGPNKCVFVPRHINCLVNDHGRARGECPIGVQRHGKGFRAVINDGSGKKKRLGHFYTQEEAHLAWLYAKREIVINLKPELDQIDTRLFDAIMSRYPLPDAINDPLYFLQEAA